jgi:hypothetical protein
MSTTPTSTSDLHEQASWQREELQALRARVQELEAAQARYLKVLEDSPRGISREDVLEWAVSVLAI